MTVLGARTGAKVMAISASKIWAYSSLARFGTGLAIEGGCRPPLRFSAADGRIERWRTVRFENHKNPQGGCTMLRIDTHGLAPRLQFRSDMDRLISEVFGSRDESLPQISGRRGNPPLDVWEEGDDYFVAANLPGLAEEEVAITALGRELTLEGSQSASGQEELADGEQESREENAGETQKPVYYHKERSLGTFHRIVRFPFDLDVEHVEGSLDAGVLTVRVPKAVSAKPRRIEIGVN
jgi:HSP20 family protein